MEDDKLKKLIQTIQPDEPDAAFTDNIMKIIEAEEAFNLSPVLLSAIKNELLADPSLEFSDNLMAAIKPAAVVVVEPVVSKKTRLIISGSAFAILFVALFGSHHTLSHLQNSSYLSGLGLNLSGATMGIVKMATTILPYIIPLSILLLADYFFRTRRHHLSSSQ